MYKNKRNYTISGFTLLEVLLAVSLSAVIIITLSTAFWRGSRAWERSKDFRNVTEDFRFSMNVLEKDLVNSIILPEKIFSNEIFISEDGKKIVFFTLKRYKNDKIPKIYKVSYMISKDLEESRGELSLQRAELKTDNIELARYEFQKEDYEKLMGGFIDKNLIFNGSFQEGFIELRIMDEKDKKEQNHIGIIKIINYDNQEIILPSKKVLLYAKP